jgi:hypothetical protein
MTCIHCGRGIRGAEYPVHTSGGFEHKSRCDPADTGHPYGLAAHRPGTPCHELCAGMPEPHGSGLAGSRREDER